MIYIKEQLNGQMLRFSGGGEYIIEYIDDENIQFYEEENPTKKYKNYTTKSIYSFIRDGEGEIVFIKPYEPNYEIY